MARISAGLLMYRKIPASAEDLQVFLVHPGGPFFKNRDDVWSIPKGLQENEEDLLETAKREFSEETGISKTSLARPRLARQTFINLSFVTYNNKVVHCWAFEGDLPTDYILKSNKICLPAGRQGWPENDRGEFFDLEIAKKKILVGQEELLERLVKKLVHLL